MSNLILPRRKFLLGTLGLIAAPAIVKIYSLMPVKSIEEEIAELVAEIKPSSNSLLTINMITKEAVKLSKNSNAFMQNINNQYPAVFSVGTELRIRLPNT